MVLVWLNCMRRVDIPGQRDSAQHAWKSTALCVPWSDRHSCSRHRGRQRSCRRLSLQWLGQWRVVGQRREGAVESAEGVEGVGEAVGHWADQRQRQEDAPLSLHYDAR
jgi:hypothetical protein